MKGRGAGMALRRASTLEWLRANPHRLHLGRIGFRLRLQDGREATRDDLGEIEENER